MTSEARVRLECNLDRLALVAPLVARGRNAAPYFVGLLLFTVVLASQSVTPLHSALYYLLPGFEEIHSHGPERIKVILYLAFALLAGATLSHLGERNRGARALVSLPVLASLLLVAGLRIPFEVGTAFTVVSLLAVVVAIGCVAVYALSCGTPGCGIAVGALGVRRPVRGGEGDRRGARDCRGGQTARKDRPFPVLRTHGAASFLRSEMEDEPARYFGFGSYLRGGKRSFHYNRFTEKDTTALLASNLGTPLGLQSIQGYNAVHLARYDEYIGALNGRSQGYHDTDVVPQGLDSPLLDLLNVRYVVGPRLRSWTRARCGS